MGSFRKCVFNLWLFNNLFLGVYTHVIDATELPSNQWSTQNIAAVKNSNSESLEDELGSLNRTNQQSVKSEAENFFSLEEGEDETVESFDDELDDIGQQRERPSDESQEEGGPSDIIVTTLVPTVLTEEETRVDEPTEKGPAQPTQENLGSAVRSDGETEISTRPTVNEGKLADEEDKLKEWKDKSEAHAPKEFKHDDYIDDAPDDDDDDFFIEESDNETVSSQQNSSERIVSRTKKELKQALYESGMFGRTTRNARLYINSPREEEMLNFLIKLAKHPKGWARVTEILGKMDYDTSARLKTALQMEALNEQKMHKGLNLLPSNYKPHVKENNVLKSHSYRAAENTKNSQHENPWNENQQRAKWHTTNSKIYNNAGMMPPSSFHDYNQHHGPIDTIAVDVPGSSFYSNRNAKEKNKQAYIAVSIYKPNKQNYRKIDSGSKTNNNLPSIFPPATTEPRVSSSKNNFGYDTIPAIEHSSSSLSHVSLNKNFGDKDIIPFYQPNNNKKPTTKDEKGKFNSKNNSNKYGNNKKKLKNGDKKFNNKKQKQEKMRKDKLKQKQKQQQKQRQKQQQQQQPADDVEAQLMALNNMELKLRQQLAEKEKMRQSMRARHRMSRSSAI